MLKGALVPRQLYCVLSKNSTMRLIPSASSAAAVKVYDRRIEESTVIGGCRQCDIWGAIAYHYSNRRRSRDTRPVIAATAVNINSPLGALLHIKPYGGAVASPSLFVPSKTPPVARCHQCPTHSINRNINRCRKTLAVGRMNQSPQ
jgi:hypothetical protein